MKKYPLNKIILYIFMIAVCLLAFYKCPFSYVLGIPCMGCGMTRAFLSLLRLDFAEAFFYHPLWILVLFLFLGWLGEKRKLYHLSPKIKVLILGISCGLFVVVYLIRLFSGSPIVAIDFENSLLYKLWTYIKSRLG